MISFENVSKRFGMHQALNCISFSVPKGQVLGLLGQNGAGKTTAMSILTGCLAPTHGTVTIGGHNIISAPREAKRLIGYLPETAPLYDEMTVNAYLRFACELKEVKKSAIDAHIEKVAKKAGLSDVLHRKIGNLSKGFCQRVGLGQALCGSPEVIILDEPTAGMDPRQSNDMHMLIKSLAKEHTVIFSSHILSEVQSLCDRIIILHYGKIICDSALQALRTGKRRLRAQIACEKSVLLPALRSIKSIEQIETETCHEKGVTQVVMHVDGEAPVERELFTLLSSLQFPLLRLSPVEDSLEEVFLRTTADGAVSETKKEKS